MLRRRVYRLKKYEVQVSTTAATNHSQFLLPLLFYGERPEIDDDSYLSYSTGDIAVVANVSTGGIVIANVVAAQRERRITLKLRCHCISMEIPAKLTMIRCCRSADSMLSLIRWFDVVAHSMLLLRRNGSTQIAAMRVLDLLLYVIPMGKTRVQRSRHCLLLVFVNNHDTPTGIIGWVRTSYCSRLVIVVS